MITSKDLDEYKENLEKKKAEAKENYDREIALIDAKLSVVEDLREEYGGEPVPEEDNQEELL